MAVLIPGIPGRLGITYIMRDWWQKNLFTTCCTQVLLLIFINYKEDEKQWNYRGKVVVSYPQWQVNITVHNARARMSVVSSECLRNGGPDKKLEQKNTWLRLP